MFKQFIRIWWLVVFGWINMALIWWVADVANRLNQLTLVGGAMVGVALAFRWVYGSAMRGKIFRKGSHWREPFWLLGWAVLLVGLVLVVLGSGVWDAVRPDLMHFLHPEGLGASMRAETFFRYWLA